MAGVDTALIYVIIGVVILAGIIAFSINLMRGRDGGAPTIERKAPPARSSIRSSC